MLLSLAILLVILAFAVFVLSMLAFHRGWLLDVPLAFIAGVLFVIASAGTLIIDVPYQVVVNNSVETGVQQVDTYPLNWVWMLMAFISLAWGVLLMLDEYLPGNPVTQWKDNINIWQQGKDAGPWRGPGIGPDKRG